MLKTYVFHSFIQRPHFSQAAKNLFRASFLTPADIAVYNVAITRVSGGNFSKGLKIGLRGKKEKHFLYLWLY